MIFLLSLKKKNIRIKENHSSSNAEDCKGLRRSCFENRLSKSRITFLESKTLVDRRSDSC